MYAEKPLASRSSGQLNLARRAGDGGGGAGSGSIPGTSTTALSASSSPAASPEAHTPPAAPTLASAQVVYRAAIDHAAPPMRDAAPRADAEEAAV